MPSKIENFRALGGHFQKVGGHCFCPENENRESSDSFLIADITRDSQWISDSAS